MMNKKFPFMIQIAHWLMYLPVAIVYFVFEVAKAILTELDKVAIAIFVLMLVFETMLMSRVFMNPFNFIRMAFSGDLWPMFMKDFFGAESVTGAESIMMRIFLVSLYLFLFIGIPLFISSVIYFSSEELNKRAKWEDWEEEFRKVFINLSDRTENETSYNRSRFFTRSAVSVVLNFVLIALLVTLGGFASKRIRSLGARNNQRRTAVETGAVNEVGSAEAESVSGDSQDYITIGASAANIRPEPGTNNTRIKVASKGESFRVTGRTEPTGSGHVWYEIFISEDGEETGWIHDSVLAK